MAVYERILYLGIAGSLGTLARYGLSGLVQKASSDSFPWGTFAVNIAGCLLFGIIWALTAEKMVMGQEVRTIILTGFMGAFTTFSSLISDSGQLLAASKWMLGLGNIALQSIAGIALFFIGLSLGRLV